MGPRDRGHGRAEGPALRRRPPVQLRRVRLTGAPAAVRHQRLRRNAARPVRVGRGAARGELRHRLAQQRVHRGGGRATRPSPRRRPTGRRWRASRRCARWRSGTRTCRPRRSWPRCARSRLQTVASNKGLDHSRTRDSLQALSEAGRGGRRALPDRVAAPGGHADPRHRPSERGRGRRRGSTRCSTNTVGRFPIERRHLLERYRCHRRGAQDRRRRQRGAAGVHRPAAGAATKTTRCSCR